MPSQSPSSRIFLRVPTLQDYTDDTAQNRSLTQIQYTAYREHPEYFETPEMHYGYGRRRGGIGLMAVLEEGGKETRVGYIIGYPWWCDKSLPHINHVTPDIEHPGLDLALESDWMAEAAEESGVKQRLNDEKDQPAKNAPLIFYLHDRVVHPSYQKRGIGRLLMDALVDHVKDVNRKYSQRVETLYGAYTFRTPLLARIWGISVHPGQMAALVRDNGFVGVEPGITKRLDNDSPSVTALTVGSRKWWAELEQKRASEIPPDYGPAQLIVKDLAQDS
ncbi:hypothetical protein HDU93_009321 [Gonapodya sp. JEL0774]|nr:hypothetical protein HDU93_009321 [Gonapodya sp. JEL0774]